MIQQDSQISFNIIDEETLKSDKEKYMRELKLQEMFENATDELKGIIDEAKKDPMDDLIYEMHQHSKDDEYSHL